ncbi:MAG: hypothetical protein J6S21_00880 [Victivallales bacterium]|nr:hypothetical protein [Victivallales bacterium]
MKFLSFLKIIPRTLQKIFLSSTSRRATLGILLFLLNFPIGWLGAMIFGAISAKTRDASYLYLATACYVFSWLLFIAGVFLAGPPTIAAVKKRIPRAVNAWKRFTSRKQE